MAKHTPFFKFDSSAWLGGSIQFTDLASKGLFIDLCAIYWESQKPIKIDTKLKVRIRCDEGTLTNLLGTLSDLDIIDQSEHGITIPFLDSLMSDRNEWLEKCSKAGKKSSTNKGTSSNKKEESRKKKEESRDKNEDKKNKDLESLEIFDIFRKAYPGTKNGNEVEFEKFKKKHSDWKKILPDLKGLLDCIINQRDMAVRTGSFVPQWKNLSTWLFNSCWTEEVGKAEEVQTTIGNGSSWT